jgi:hypothetical protein
MNEQGKLAEIEWFKNGLQHHESLTNALAGFEQTLLRGALLLNGGAIVALLSVYSALNNKPAVQGPPAVWALGLGLCALAAWFAFLSQWKFQIAASRHYQRLAEHFFALHGPPNRCLSQIAKNAVSSGGIGFGVYG